VLKMWQHSKEVCAEVWAPQEEWWNITEMLGKFPAGAARSRNLQHGE
jgi:hypothetical protein